MGQFTKKWEELNFSDNFIFCKVMRDKNLCKKMLEILLGLRVREIDYIETEKTFEEVYDGHGIRMDVYLEGDDKIYDLEMQTGDYKNLLLRARYYQSASDIASTPRRTKYQDLKETIIIFICKDDPFGDGLPCYTEIKAFKETPNIVYDDKTKKVFYNSSAFAKAENEDVRNVLEFIYTLKADSKFTKELEHSVENAKAKPLFRNEYMYFSDVLEMEKEEARASGLAEGRAEGLAEGRAENSLKNAVIAVKEFKIPVEVVAEKFGVSQETLLNMLNTDSK